MVLACVFASIVWYGSQSRNTEASQPTGNHLGGSAFHDAAEEPHSTEKVRESIELAETILVSLSDKDQPRFVPRADPRAWSNVVTLESRDTPIEESHRLILRQRIAESSGFDSPVLLEELVEIDPATGYAHSKLVSAMIADELLVTFPANFNSQDIDELTDHIGWDLKRRIDRSDTFVLKAKRIDIDSISNAIDRAKTYETAHTPFTAEPNYIIYAAATTPNDTYYSSDQWALNGDSPGLEDIDAPEGWDIRTDASNSVIAILDTGINIRHEDLSTNIWQNQLEIDGNAIDDDNNGYIDDAFGFNAIAKNGNGIDDNGHGTHVAGIAGAVGNNGKGIAGVAWKAKLMPVKILNSDGAGTLESAISGIQYAIANGADIINASWGGNDRSAALQNAINQAESAGILFVAAAGNSLENIDEKPHYPASYSNSNIVSVGSVDPTGLPSNFTNYGFRSVDIFAPGQDVISTWHEANDAYAIAEGTSTSAPLVSGILALLISEYPTDDYKSQIRRLLHKAKKRDHLDQFTHSKGFTNLFASLSASTPPHPPEFDPLPSTRTYSELQGESISISASATSPNGVSYQWFHQGAAIDGETSNTLVLDSVQTSQSGSYRLDAFNSDGVSCIPFQLTIIGERLDLKQSAGLENITLFTPDGVFRPDFSDDSWDGNSIFSEFQSEIFSGTLNAKVEGPKELRFYWKQSPLAGYTTKLLVNGIDTQLSPTEDWTPVVVPVESASRSTVSWIVLRDANTPLNPADGLHIDGFELYDIGKPTPLIISQPTSIQATINSRAELEVAVSLPQESAYQWIKNGAPIPGANSKTLVFDSLTLADVGTYNVEVTNQHGATKSRNVTIRLDGSAAQIVSQPDSFITRQAGDNLTLNFILEGTDPIQYQWYKGEQALSLETSNQLQLWNIGPIDRSDYRLEYFNPGMDAPRLSDSVFLSIEEKIPPTILGALPATVTLNIGSDLQISGGNAAGTEPIEYQWYKDNELLEGFTAGDLIISGVNNSDAGVYHYEARNSYGFVQSGRTRVVVADELVGNGLDNENQTWRVNAWSNTLLTVDTIDSYDNDDSLSIERASDGSPFTASFSTTISGPSNVRFAIKESAIPGDYFFLSLDSTPLNTYMVTDGENGWKQIEFFVPDGEHELTINFEARSNDGRFHLDSFALSKAPLFLQQPQSGYYSVGKSASLFFDANGEEPIQYQWYKDDAPIPGATSNSIVLENLSVSNSGTYHAVATNVHGSRQTNPATVSVLADSTLFDASSSFEISAGGDAPFLWNPRENSDTDLALKSSPLTFNQTSWIELTVTGPTTLTWDMKNASMSYSMLIDGNNTSYPAIVSNDWSSYAIEVAEGTHTYRWISNGNSAGTESEKTLWLDNFNATENPVAIAGFDSRSFALGDPNAQLFFFVYGNEPFSFDWLKDGIEWNPPNQIDSDSSSAVQFKGFTENDAGLYQLRVTDADGKQSISNQIELVADGSITASIDLISGFAIPSGGPNWSIDNHDFVNGESSLRIDGTGATTNNGSLSIYQVGKRTTRFFIKTEGFSDSDEVYYYDHNNFRRKLTSNINWTQISTSTFDGPEGYRVAAIEYYIQNLDTAKIWIDSVTSDNAPRITRQPENLSAVNGSSHSISVEAVSVFETTYQWFKDNNPIPGAQSSELHFDSTSQSDAGSYYAQLTSGGDSIVTDTVSVSIANNDFPNAADFPSALISTSGQKLWTVDANTSKSGGSSLRSGAIVSGQETSLVFDVKAPANMGFYFRSDLSDEYDVRMTVDGDSGYNIRSNQWQYISFFVTGSGYKRVTVSISRESPLDAPASEDGFAWLDELTVRPLANTRYDQWARSFANPTASSDSASLADPNADSDNDGIPNIAEFLFALDPFSASELPAFILTESGFQISYNERTSQDYQLVFESSSNLLDWGPIRISAAISNSELDVQTVDALFPLLLNADTAMFIRWRIEPTKSESVSK